MKFFLHIFLLTFTLEVTAQGYVKMKAKAEEAFNNYEYENAVTWANDAMMLAQVEAGEKSLEYAACMKDLGIYEFYNYQYAEGIAHVEDACIIIKDKVGEKDTTYALAYSDLGSLYYMSEEHAKAMGVFQVTMKLQAELSGPNSIDYAYELNKAGLAQTRLGLFAEAEKNLRASQRIFELNKMDKSADYGYLLNNIADLFHSKGQHISAAEYYELSLKHAARTEGKESLSYVTTLENLGNLYAETGRLEEGKKVFTECLAIHEKLFTAESAEYAKSLNDLAYCEHHLGDYVASEKFYSKSLDIKERLSGKDNATYRRTLSNLAVLYMDYGNYDRAREIMEGLMKDGARDKRESPMNYLIWVENLIILYAQINELEKAVVLQKEVMEMQLKLSGEENADYIMMLNTLSDLLVRSGNFKEAELVMLKAILLAEKISMQESEDYLVLLYQAGLLYSEIKDYAKSRTYLERSLAMARKNLNPKNPLYNNILINLGEVLRKLKDYQSADPLYAEAMKVYAEILSKDAPFMSSMERSSYTERLKLHFSLYKSYALERVNGRIDILEDLYAFNSQFRSLQLKSEIAMKEAVMASDRQDLIETYSKWRDLREYLNKLYQLPGSELAVAGLNIDSLEKSAVGMEKKISEGTAALSRTISPPAGSAEVSASLGPDEAAIEIIRIPHYGQDEDEFNISYLAMIIYPGGKKCTTYTVLHNGRKMEIELSDMYYSAIFGKTEDANSYHIFWKAIADKVEDYKALYVSRDGIYNILNINTLQDYESKAFVIDKWNIHYINGTSSLIGRKGESSAKSNGGIHLFGYPDYYYSEATNLEADVTNNAGQASRGRQINTELQFISDLPGTKAEVESVKAVLEQESLAVNLYLGRDATESKLKSLQNPSVLHIATHGFFEFDVPEQDREITAVSRSATVNQSLLRSGIMMAGSAYVLKLVKDNVPFLEDFEDGVLNGLEASNMRLENTDLVVLSACLTSVGDAKINDGEGYYGMLRAFLAAGAKSVIASCWAVDDAATKDLMISFYSGWKDKANYYGAFRNAQLAAKTKYPHPYYWGAFIMVE